MGLTRKAQTDTVYKEGPIGKSSKRKRERERGGSLSLSRHYLLSLSTYLPFFLSVQMLQTHSHLHPHLFFPSPFPFTSKTNTLHSLQFPATSIRTTSSSLRFRHRGRCSSVTNSALNGAANETEHQKKQQVNRPYPFHEIEPKWQSFWEHNRTFRTPDDDIDFTKPKYYVLDMFPYPRFSILVPLCAWSFWFLWIAMRVIFMIIDK